MSTKKLSELKAFPARLIWLREKSGFSGEEFGRRCNVGKSYISRLESGDRFNPSAEFLTDCCAAFGVPRDWLENGIGQPPNVSLVAHMVVRETISDANLDWLLAQDDEEMLCAKAARVLADKELPPVTRLNRAEIFLAALNKKLSQLPKVK